MINIRSFNPDLDLDLAEQYILSCFHYGSGCNGNNAYNVFMEMYAYGGTIPESCFPYTGSDTTTCSNKCSQWEDSLVPISSYGRYYGPGREFIKNQLVNHGPIVTGMYAASDFNSYSGGIYEHPGNEYPSWINHQVLLVGYNDDQQYWICKNSWGQYWGENGFFKIAYGDCAIEYELVWVDYTHTAPVTIITDGPSGTIDYTTVTFEWTATDDNLSLIHI